MDIDMDLIGNFKILKLDTIQSKHSSTAATISTYPESMALPQFPVYLDLNKAFEKRYNG